MQQELELYELVLDSIHNGVLITDPNGVVIYMNKPYGDFLGLDPKAQVGRHCTEVLKYSRMHIVARTGRPEINDPQLINGQNVIVQRIPIRKNGKIVAVYGQVMFKNAREVESLAGRLSLLQAREEIQEQDPVNLRSTRYTFDSIVGPSPEIIGLKQKAMQAAKSDYPVLISGESGTGKEIFAQAVHQASPRGTQPFVRINCAAIPRDLLESELFGYAGGAFTGALPKGKRGKFELANHGTVFLDEIGELPLEMQPKLLQVLEEKEFERIGGNKIIKSDYRVIAATNKDLEEMVRHNRFRSDLYYRLNVIPLQIPPLRQRKADIPALARHTLNQLAEQTGKPAAALSGAAEAKLKTYSWPGNVRELINVLERIFSVTEKSVITADSLPLNSEMNESPPAEISPSEPSNLRAVLEQTEKRTIEKVLQEAGGNKMAASRKLGIHRTHLYKKIKKFGLQGSFPAS